MRMESCWRESWKCLTWSEWRGAEASQGKLIHNLSTSWRISNSIPTYILNKRSNSVSSPIRIQVNSTTSWRIRRFLRRCWNRLAWLLLLRCLNSPIFQQLHRLRRKVVRGLAVSREYSCLEDSHIPLYPKLINFAQFPASITMGKPLHYQARKDAAK